ncbi:hypothetical protein L208DRAFT_1335072 [Tricholoma matsutake]|nr:hypothetical protein L208DRAFT_1335072 [Tricholoma matsutake 945]
MKLIYVCFVTAKEKKKEEKERKESKKEEQKAREKADDPKAGADVEKIVNLMTRDANKISQMGSGLYFLYVGFPFCLYINWASPSRLLRWSAFAGFVVLLAGWPLNSFIARRSIRIQKGLLAARDKWMGVLNELIGSVKFIKFFVWEERSIERALDAREHEMKWMTKSHMNSVLFYLSWTCAPILVLIISFFAYMMQGKELTVSIAFTSIALSNMIRYAGLLFGTGVALNHIAVYLNEDEVSSEVSSLKSDGLSSPTPTVDEGLGLENASFKWNEVEEVKPKDEDVSKTSVISQTPSPTNVDHHFELQDINIRFPEGQLSVITGLTASGKTALLVCCLIL